LFLTGKSDICLSFLQNFINYHRFAGLNILSWVSFTLQTLSLSHYFGEDFKDFVLVTHSLRPNQIRSNPKCWIIAWTDTLKWERDRNLYFSRKYLENYILWLLLSCLNLIWDRMNWISTWLYFRLPSFLVLYTITFSSSSPLHFVLCPSSFLVLLPFLPSSCPKTALQRGSCMGHRFQTIPSVQTSYGEDSWPEFH